MGEGQAEARLKRDAEEAAAAEAAEEAEAEAAEAEAANVSTLWRRPALFRDNNTTESRLKKERLEGARPPLASAKRGRPAVSARYRSFHCTFSTIFRF